MDTIYALATAQGKAGVAVIRISGPEAHRASTRLVGSVPSVRQTGLRKFVASDGRTLDHGLVIVFEHGASFTGEQSAEFHLHGSIATVRAVLSELSAIPGLRMAEPGEFTRRALENGRLDLPEVEGLADLIESETEAQRRLALRLFEGEFGKRVASWRSKLVEALSYIAVTIDFSDEDVPEEMTDQVRALISSVLDELKVELRGMAAAERIRTGFEVAIVGPPNIGKSTLLNTLAGRDAALTSEIAGTTRDVIEVRMDLAGLPVTFLDTAGLRETDDLVESLGIERARKRAKGADLRVILTEPGHLVGIDLLDGDILLEGRSDFAVDGVGVSGKTGAGVNHLIQMITERLQDQAAGASLATQERHRLALCRAIEPLEDALQSMDTFNTATELTSEDIRQATQSLDVLVGKIDVEDLLETIFRKFCLGK